jgi:hypothetical protein
MILILNEQGYVKKTISRASYSDIILACQNISGQEYDDDKYFEETYGKMLHIKKG